MDIHDNICNIIKHLSVEDLITFSRVNKLISGICGKDSRLIDHRTIIEKNRSTVNNLYKYLNKHIQDVSRLRIWNMYNVYLSNKEPKIKVDYRSIISVNNNSLYFYRIPELKYSPGEENTNHISYECIINAVLATMSVTTGNIQLIVYRRPYYDSKKKHFNLIL